jgi:hypothetical protein
MKLNCTSIHSIFYWRALTLATGLLVLTFSSLGAEGQNHPAGIQSNVAYNLLTGPIPIGIKGTARAQKAVALKGAGVTHVLGNGPGAPFMGSGFVDNLFLAFMGSKATAKDSTIQIYLDGSATPVVNENWQLFCASYQRDLLAGTTSSPYFHATGFAEGAVSLNIRLPIPFKKSIAIDCTNGDPTRAANFYSMCSYNIVPIESIPLTQKLYSSVQENDSCPPYSVQTLLNVSPGVPGQLAGFFMVIDGSAGNAQPISAPMEGKFEIYVDGSSTPSFETSGTEDLLSKGFYFDGYPDNTPGSHANASFCDEDRGLIYKESGKGTYMFYRLWTKDPIKFTKSLKITWNAGETQGGIAWKGTVKELTNTWYYTQ